MDEYGLVLEPEQPDEAFEALSDTMEDRVFTYDEAIECIRSVLNISHVSAKWRLAELIRNGNVRELT